MPSTSWMMAAFFLVVFGVVLLSSASTSDPETSDVVVVLLVGEFGPNDVSGFRKSRAPHAMLTMPKLRSATSEERFRRDQPQVERDADLAQSSSW